MTVDDVKQRIEEIKALASDDEVAHSKEDSLRHAVLKAIAAGAPNAAGLASAVLLTSEIDFRRWYA